MGKKKSKVVPAKCPKCGSEDVRINEHAGPEGADDYYCGNPECSHIWGTNIRWITS